MTTEQAASLYADGRAAWPRLDVAFEAFAAALAAHTEAVTDGPELYLACACAARDATAIATFEARYFGCIAAVARRLGLSASDADEIAQVLRQRLFVAESGTPRVVEYAGRGRLAGLVQVAATRIALNLRRGQARQSDEPTPEPAPAPAGDAAYAKAEYREHVRRALADAAAALPVRDRTLLRMHLVDRASIDDIAAVYRVHRATAARWVSAARATLIEQSRDRFLAIAQLEPEDTAGLASFVESQLTLSLDRILT